MTDIHQLTEQTDSDRRQLLQNLKEGKKDMRLELIIFGALWLIAPFLTNRPGQKPMIENMSYGMALLLFGLVLLIPLSVTYYRKVHKAVLGCQTDLKRVIITQVTGKIEKPIFSKESYCLKVADPYLRKLYLPRHKSGEFEIGSTLRIEVSENGKQVIKITNATETIIKRIQNKTPESSSLDKRSYSSVLFGKDSSEKTSILSYFSFLIPSKDNFVSAIILDINIIVFILMLLNNVSIYKPLAIDIVRWGGNVRILTIDHKEYWRLLTNVFVHIGIIHLLMNGVGFILVSVFLEKKLGRAWFLSMYLLTGICASLTSAYWHINTVSAGASGAIFGLYGLYLAILVFVNKNKRELNVGMITTILIFVGYNLLMGITGGIDNAAHIGGLLSGFVAGVIMVLSGITKKGRKRKSSIGLEQ
ncbi:MAG TPA: rhomboid family intramembrane serine protease [Chitinophagaceae bacterium]|nr:rhomboid family intramembrane serine protease [Chitinophagaceae bacterium]